MCLAAPFIAAYIRFPWVVWFRTEVVMETKSGCISLCFRRCGSSVKVAMVFVVLQGIEGTAGIEDKFVGIDVRQDHAGTAFQRHPAGNLQGRGLQENLRADIIPPEQAVLNDAGGMGGVQGHEGLFFHHFQADGRSGRDQLGQLAAFSGQNANGFLFDELIGNVGLVGFQGGQGQIDLPLLQQPFQTGGGGLRQLDGHIGIGLGENGDHIRKHLHGPGNADAQPQAAAVIPADAFNFFLQRVSMSSMASTAFR